jgi:hypothetical protein
VSLTLLSAGDWRVDRLLTVANDFVVYKSCTTTTVTYSRLSYVVVYIPTVSIVLLEIIKVETVEILKIDWIHREF